MPEGKILIVDDSPLVRKLSEVSLKEAGYEVYTAADGEEALKIAETEKPDLILVDFIMPKMTGSKLCELIRKSENLKDTPVILVTGKGEKVVQTFIEKYNVSDYFIKPFKSEQLVEKITTILGKVYETYRIPQEEVLIEELQTEVEQPIQEYEIPQEEVEEVFPVEQFSIEQPIQEYEIPQEEVEEVFPVEQFSIEQPIQYEVEEIEEAFETLKEPEKLRKPFFNLRELEKLIEDKFYIFAEKIPSLFDISVEGVLKKYGLIKDQTQILSGVFDYFNPSDIFHLISSNTLTGIFSVYGKGIAYEFLFINGETVYGLSNFQKQNIGHRLLNEIPPEEVKQLTIEALSSLMSIKNGSFVFERRQFFDDALLNKIKYKPSDLFKERVRS